MLSAYGCWQGRDGMGQEVPSREPSEAVTNGCVERKWWRQCVGEARGGVGLSAAR